MAAHSSILAWGIPGTAEPVGWHLWGCTESDTTEATAAEAVAIFCCIQVLQLLYPFICQWTSRLLPCPSYGKQCCNEHRGICAFFSFGFLRVYAQQWASLEAQTVKKLSTMWETWVQSPSWEDPRRREWQPTPVFFPEEFHGQRSLVSYSPWGHKELDMAEQLTHTHIHTWQFYSQIFKESPYFSPQWLYPFIFLPTVQEGSLFSTSSSSIYCLQIFLMMAFLTSVR